MTHFNVTARSLPEPIESHPAQDVLDNTKIQTYMDCPRKYFYEHILGWRLDMPPKNHLFFGECIHEALEYLVPAVCSGTDKGEALMHAWKLFEKKYRSRYPATTDAQMDPKTPGNAKQMLSMFLEYETFDFEMLHPETAGVVEIAEGRPIHFKMDLIGKRDNGIFFRDYKTASRIDRAWTEAWSTSTQMGTYTFALHCLYPNDEIYGGQVIGLLFQKKGLQVIPVPIRKPFDMVEFWLWQANETIDKMERDLDYLEQATDEDVCLKAFPHNPGACTKYGACPFLSFCGAWANPLRRCHKPQPGYKVEFWDPRKKTEEDVEEDG